MQHKVEELTKSVTEAVAALSVRRNSGIQGSLGPSFDQVNDGSQAYIETRRPSDFGKQVHSSRPTPKRFLSYNPYMHMPVYDNVSKVKEAAWSFRRSSLKSSRPSKEELMQALASQETMDGEDTVDAPPRQREVCFYSQDLISVQLLFELTL